MDRSNNQFVPPPKPTLTVGSPDCELWLDIVLAAVAGYTAAGWQNDRGKVQMVSASIVTKAAIEVADGIFAEYKNRLDVKKEGE